MRLPVFITTVIVLSCGGCRASRDAPTIPGDNVPEQAEGIEQTKENPDTLVVELGIEQMPSIIGGMKAIREKLNYPQDARDAGIEGRVFVKFIVDLEGQPQQVEVFKGLCASCDAEAIRLIEQTRFIPGYIVRAGTKTPEAMPMSLPIEFKLPHN